MMFASGEYAGGSFAQVQSTGSSGRNCTANIAELNDSLNSDATNDSTILTIECAYNEQNDLLLSYVSHELQAVLNVSDLNDLLSSDISLEIICTTDIIVLDDSLSGDIIASSKLCNLNIVEQDDTLLAESNLSLADGTWYPRESVTIIWIPKNEFA